MSNIDFFVHSGDGIDCPELIDVAADLSEARKIAAAELARWPDQIVTIIDRFGVEHSL